MSNKQRGDLNEREIVKVFNDHWMHLCTMNIYDNDSHAKWTAKRAYMSQGSSLGFDDKVDVAVFDSTREHGAFRIQAKRRKTLYKYLETDLLLPELATREKFDAVVLRTDKPKKAHYIIMDLNYFVKEFYA